MNRLYDRSYLAALVSQTGFVMANMLLAHYARWIDFLGGGVREVGWIMGAGAIGGVLLRPWMGQWINRLGPRNTWAIGYAIFVCGALGNLLLADLGWFIYALRSCLIIGASLVFASSLTYVTQTAPVNRQTEAIGTLGVGGFIGMLLGPYLGDLILGSGARTRADFNFLFIAAAVAVLIPAVALLFLKPTHPDDRSPAVRLKDFFGTTIQYWPGTILLVNALFGLCMTIPMVFLAKYVDETNLSLPGGSVIGLFFLCYAGWGMTLRLSLRRFPDRFGRRKVLLVGIAIMGIGMLTYPLVDAEHVWRIMIPALICGTGHSLMFHTGTSLILESFPSKVRGTGSSLSLTMLDVGLIAGAPVLGSIADRHGYDWLFIAVGASCFLVGAIYAWSSIPVWRARREELEGRAVDVA